MAAHVRARVDSCSARAVARAAAARAPAIVTRTCVVASLHGRCLELELMKIPMKLLCEVEHVRNARHISRAIGTVGYHTDGQATPNIPRQDTTTIIIIVNVTLPESGSLLCCVLAWKGGWEESREAPC